MALVVALGSGRDHAGRRALGRRRRLAVAPRLPRPGGGGRASIRQRRHAGGAGRGAPLRPVRAARPRAGGRDAGRDRGTAHVRAAAGRRRPQHGVGRRRPAATRALRDARHRPAGARQRRPLSTSRWRACAHACTRASTPPSAWRCTTATRLVVAGGASVARGSAVAHVLGSGAPLFVPDAGGRGALRRCFVAPLGGRGGVVGALAIERAGDIAADERRWLPVLAAHVGLTLENARLAARQRRFADELAEKVDRRHPPPRGDGSDEVGIRGHRLPRAADAAHGAAGIQRAARHAALRRRLSCADRRHHARRDRTARPYRRRLPRPRAARARPRRRRCAWTRVDAGALMPTPSRCCSARRTRTTSRSTAPTACRRSTPIPTRSIAW